jgi:uncharacterized membrane protein
MAYELTPKNHTFPRWLQFLLSIILVIGIFVRFYNLDTKVYWSHEAITSLRISGYTVSELIEQIYTGKEINSKDIQKFLHPNSEKNIFDTLQSFAIEDSQHTPLYYLLAHFWAQAFGSSILEIRLLSALISLLAIPCFYWLCLELFESSVVGWVAIALSAVSLLHIIYAQEARQYSLWIVTTLLSNAILLRALKGKNLLFYWGSYGVSLSLGLYTFPLTGLVGASHGIYIFCIESYKLSRNFIYYLLSSLFALATFLPWLWIIIKQRNKIIETIAWLRYDMPFVDLITSWLVHITMIFTSPSRFFSVIIVTILVAYSILYIIFNAPKPVWLFVLLFISIPAIGLVIPDLIFGGKLSSPGRYQLSNYLGIQLAVAYLFAHQITFYYRKLWQRRLWQIILVCLLLVEVRICFKYLYSPDGWAKNDNYNPPISSIINQSQSPLIITDLNKEHEVGSVLSLSYYLDPDVTFKLLIQPQVYYISNRFSDVFIYSPSNQLRSSLEENLKLKAVLLYKDPNPVNNNPATLWKLDKS